MLHKVKQGFKKAVKRNGWVVERYRPHRDRFQLLSRLCADHECQLLIDVGANEGQFATEMIDAGFEREIVSVEPQDIAHRALGENARAHRSWTVAPRMCVGDRDGTTTLHVAANSVSSSVLPVLEKSIEAEAGTRFVGDETVPVRRLDSWIAEYRPGAAAIALKLDVQGFERQVLAGADELLKRIPVLTLEMSLVPLYRDAATFSELFALLEAAGYASAGIFPGFTDPQSMRMLQVDGVFERRAA